MNKTDKLQPLQEMAITYANSLPGAKAYWREDWETYYFDIMGKMFGIVHDNVITLKNDPYINTELREQFPFIIPGYHMNKQHWNSIIVDKNALDVENDIQGVNFLLIVTSQSVVDYLSIVVQQIVVRWDNTRLL